MYNATYLYVSTNFSFCVFIFTFSFLLFCPRNTRNLQCFTQFHCKLPITLQSWKILHSLRRKKKCYALIFLWCKVFPLSFSIYFLFSFCSDCRSKQFFSYHILTNILSTNYHNCFVTKNIPYRKLSFNSKEHSKTRNKHVLTNYVLLILMFFQMIILQRYGRILLLHQKRSEATVCRCFNKIGVLETFSKFTGKQLCLSHFLIRLQA